MFTANPVVTVARNIAAQGNTFKAARVLKMHGFPMVSARLLLAIKPKAK